MTTTIPDMPGAAMARLVPILDAYRAGLGSAEQATFDELRMMTGGISVPIVVSDGPVAVHVVFMLSDGPHTVLELDGARIGLREVGGEVVYDDTLD